MITLAGEENMDLLHNAGGHDGIDESRLLGQLGVGEGVLDGDVLLVVVEQSLGSSQSWFIGKVTSWVTDDQTVNNRRSVTE